MERERAPEDAQSPALPTPAGAVGAIVVIFAIVVS
jgi:hypothetical protein